MLFPDKIYHIISELANLRFALFHLMNGRGGAKKQIWQMDAMLAYCFDLFVVLFLPLFIYIYIYFLIFILFAIWLTEREREREDRTNSTNHTYTHDSLTLYIYMDMFGQNCLWQQVKFMTNSKRHEAYQWHIHMEYRRSKTGVWSTVSLLKRSQVSTPISVK